MNPYAILQEYRLKRDVWNREEISEMLNTLRNSKLYLKSIHGQWMKARDVLIFIMMFEEGARPREICSLKFKDIDLRKMTLYIDENNNKTRKSRMIPLCNRVMPALKAYLSFPRWMWNKSPYLFPSFANRMNHLSSERWKMIFREKICRPSGFYKVPDQANKSRTSAYCLRHSRATEMLENTGDIDLVAHMLGHADTRITRSYLHYTKQRYGKLVDAMNENPGNQEDY